MRDPPRRLMAVLVADVQGYTRLMERNEEHTRLTLNCHRLRFQNFARSHDGRVVDTAGDSILAEFPSVRRSVECAVAFQCAMDEFNADVKHCERMEFRVGINAGDVLDDNVSIWGDVVNTAARIQELAAPGGVCVSGVVQDMVAGSAAVGFQFLREQRVKNRSRPICVYRVLMAAQATSRSSESVAPLKLSMPGEPGIAVLPFQNPGLDPTRQYIGDGIAEDIITELSRFPSINVVARTTSFSYRHEDDCFRKLRDELNVQYALEGSVRSVGQKIRITAQLVDCDSGNHIWCDCYTHDAEAIFDVQDEVVSLIVSMLENRMMKDRLCVSVKSSSKTHKAYDYWLRGNQLIENLNYENNRQAAGFFHKAIELDPNFSRAYTSLASICFRRLALGPGEPDWQLDNHQAFQYCRKALSLDSSDGRAHVNMGWAYFLKRDFENGRRHYGIAGDLNPNDADILVGRGRAQAFLGEAEVGLEFVNRALRLNPVHPKYYLEYLAMVQFFARRFEDCAHTFAQSPPTTPENTALLASAHSHLDQRETARMAVHDFIRSFRDCWQGAEKPSVEQCVDWLSLVLPLQKIDDRELFGEGLYRAGLSQAVNLVSGAKHILISAESN